MNLSELKTLLPGTSPPAQTYYRAVDARYAAAIDEMAHTILYSWRYNPKEEFGVLYLSISPQCAWREKLRQVQGREEDLPSQVVGSFRVNLTRCLDMTDLRSQERIGVSREHLIDPTDFSTTQSLAREARKLGFEAIIAPSAVGPDCHSLAVFKDKLAPPSYCIYDPASLHAYP